MSRIKLSFLIGAGLILVLSIAFPLIFWGANVLPLFGGDLAVYISFKVVVSLALIVVALLIAFGHRHEGAGVLEWILVFMLQLLPLVIRLIGSLLAGVSPVNQVTWAINLSIGLVVVVGYVIFEMAWNLQNAKFVATKKKVEPKQIKVVDSDSFYDENGNLKGPGQK